MSPEDIIIKQQIGEILAILPKERILLIESFNRLINILHEAFAEVHLPFFTNEELKNYSEIDKLEKKIIELEKKYTNISSLNDLLRISDIDKDKTISIIKEQNNILQDQMNIQLGNNQNEVNHYIQEINSLKADLNCKQQDLCSSEDKIHELNNVKDRLEVKLINISNQIQTFKENDSLLDVKCSNLISELHGWENKEQNYKKIIENLRISNKVYEKNSLIKDEKNRKLAFKFAVAEEEILKRDTLLIQKEEKIKMLSRNYEMTRIELSKIGLNLKHKKNLNSSLFERRPCEKRIGNLSIDNMIQNKYGEKRFDQLINLSKFIPEENSIIKLYAKKRKSKDKLKPLEKLTKENQFLSPPNSNPLCNTPNLNKKQQANKLKNRFATFKDEMLNEDPEDQVKRTKFSKKNLEVDKKVAKSGFDFKTEKVSIENEIHKKESLPENIMTKKFSLNDSRKTTKEIKEEGVVNDQEESEKGSTSQEVYLLTE